MERTGSTQRGEGNLRMAGAGAGTQNGRQGGGAKKMAGVPGLMKFRMCGSS